MTSFAYPYGAYEDWMHEELLKYYKSLRGAFRFEAVFKVNVNNGFIESASLDNINFESDEEFREVVETMLDSFCECDEGTAASVYSHSIGAGDWCITETRLEILLQEAAERNIRCCTFKELQ